MRSIRRRLVPYGLLAPGAIWLLLFFVVPMYYMGEMALRSGALETGGFRFTWEWANFPDALEGRGELITRTFLYTVTATVLALLIAYPLAYAIAIKVSRRWRLLLLFAVIAPFFTTYLVRTIAWKTILADPSPMVDVLKFVGIVPIPVGCGCPAKTTFFACRASASAAASSCTGWLKATTILAMRER